MKKAYLLLADGTLFEGTAVGYEGQSIGEGVFNTLLTGPGKVWLQTMPISSVAMAIRPFIPTGNN